MKKLIVAVVLALLFVAVAEQRASAWFRIKVGGCAHFGVAGALPCVHFGICPRPLPHCDGHGHDMPGYWPAQQWPYGHVAAQGGWAPSYAAQGYTAPSYTAPSYTAPAPRPVQQQSYGSYSWNPYYGPHYVNAYR
jgi:hypothetical protein